ncbi:MAG: hypothetical protein HC905_26680 [Bacteroidales bacterium]|nr:hypothetical protein [Bacteroidales bacterium]
MENQRNQCRQPTVKKFFTNRYNWIGSVGKPFIHNNKAYFCVSNGDWSDARIYSMDGSTEDTTMLIKLLINNGTLFYDPEFTEINGIIYFRDNSSLYKIENNVVTLIYSIQNTLYQLEALGNKILLLAPILIMEVKYG